MEIKIKTATEADVFTFALEEAIERMGDQVRWLRTAHADAVGCIADYEAKIEAAKRLLKQIDKVE